MTILELLENDGRLTPKELAVMLDKETGDIKKEIEQLENEIADVKNKEFNRLSKQYFAAESDEKRTELEVEIKALMRE